MAAHPLRLWMDNNGHSYRTLAEACAARGLPVTDQWLKMIALRRGEPGYDLALLLSQITGISFDVLKPSPFKGKKRSAA